MHTYEKRALNEYVDDVIHIYYTNTIFNLLQSEVAIFIFFETFF